MAQRASTRCVRVLPWLAYISAGVRFDLLLGNSLRAFLALAPESTISALPQEVLIKRRYLNNLLAAWTLQEHFALLKVVQVQLRVGGVRVLGMRPEVLVLLQTELALSMLRDARGALRTDSCFESLLRCLDAYHFLELRDIFGEGLS